ncbi:MAG: protein kinase, partial [Planctomycetes bacterium]|nr:protein kinase [Planctomycetota bacterium]
MGPSDDGRRIGPYRIVRQIGGGAQGEVYLAEDTRIARRVALKVLAADFAPSEAAVERFRREAQAASRLDHPGICTVYEADIAGRTPYIAMRYLEGETLAARIEAASPTGGSASSSSSSSRSCRPVPLPIAAADASAVPAPAPSAVDDALQVVSMIESVARALHVAHEAGLVHRDVKPANIMLTPGCSPVILDFGLAHDDSSSARLTRTGTSLGSPAYMAPELIATSGAPVDRRADVYSLGVTLFEALTMALPYAAPTLAGLYDQILRTESPHARSRNAEIPRDLDVVVATAMEKDPDRRYRTARDFADDLRRVLRNEPVRARPAGRIVRLRRWAQRNPGLSASLAALLVALSAGLAASLHLAGVARDESNAKSVALRRVRVSGLRSESGVASVVDPMLGLLLAREAARLDPSPETIATLRTAVGASYERARLTCDDAALSVAISPRGDRVLAASADGTARILDVSGHEVAVLRGHESAVKRAVWSPSGARIGTASWDRTARIYVADGTETAALRGHTGWVTWIAFAADESHVVTASRDHTARIWTVDGASVAVLAGHTDEVWT